MHMIINIWPEFNVGYNGSENFASDKRYGLFLREPLDGLYHVNRL